MSFAQLNLRNTVCECTAKPPAQFGEECRKQRAAHPRGTRRRPAELPSPILAGAASLIAFSLGALVPLLPYLFGWPVLPASLGVTAVALLCGGMIVGRLTRRPVLRSGLRQLLLSALAVAITFGAGSLIGHHAG